MTLVLDSGGLSALAANRALLTALRERHQWPAVVPCIVLTEALTGDHRRDFAINRLLRACQVRPVDEQHARTAARLRTATGRASSITATDAIVAAVAAAAPGPVVLTSDPSDLRALCEHADLPVTIAAV